jgi:hypothetical protein
LKKKLLARRKRTPGVSLLLRYGLALKEMHDNRNYRKQKQQVDQGAGDVKHQKAAEPQ